MRRSFLRTCDSSHFSQLSRVHTFELRSAAQSSTKIDRPVPIGAVNHRWKSQPSPIFPKTSGMRVAPPFFGWEWRSQRRNRWWAGGDGGIPKPSWQSGVTGIPDDFVRDLPDVSLSAASHDPYVLCLEGSCVPNSQGEFYLYFVSGTSASTPSFASIMALVDQPIAT